jgi:translation initiation factor 4A
MQESIDNRINNIEQAIKKIYKWDELHLSDSLLRGIFSFGFEEPSEIQRSAILPIIENKDLIAQAQSGCGKTGTFAIGTLQRIDVLSKNPQVLILSPTHELVYQTASVIKGIGSFMEGLRVKTLVGGTNVKNDVNELQQLGSQVIVGTVGRVLDMIQKHYLKTQKLKMLILDEADEMLSQGFNEKIKIMFQQYFPLKMQVVLFSATMPPEIIKISENFMNNPVQILVKKEELSLQCIQQYFVAVKNDKCKYDTLRDLFSMITLTKCIIYCNSVTRVIDLYQALMDDGFSVCCIHSNMDKGERQRIFQHFRSGDTRILISSDITSRGIDIQQVSTVINFDLTRNVHTYLHRIGRGGRWGRKGVAINFISPYDLQDIRAIEKYYNIDIPELPANFHGEV